MGIPAPGSEAVRADLVATRFMNQQDPLPARIIDKQVAVPSLVDVEVPGVFPDLDYLQVLPTVSFGDRVPKLRR